MKTLLLDQNIWDLVKDAHGNIALASEPYAIAQDVASAVRVFLGEVWYDTAQGVPYLQQILGKRPPAQFIKDKVAAAGKTTPEVAEIKVTLTGFVDRHLTGQMLIIDTRSRVSIVSFLEGRVPWYINAITPHPFSE